MQECLGVDLGNVIIDHAAFGTSPEFVQSGDYNIIPSVPGMFEALWKLNQGRFKNRIFVVYNASDVADEKIQSWLANRDFFTRTGVSPGFVQRTQHGRNKLSICERYKATHFIDDRLEVLGHLAGKVSNLYLFRPQKKEIERHRSALIHVQRVVHTWEEILDVLME